MYTAHARNLARGTDYFDTGYLVHESTAEISPTSCPPVFPLVISLVYRFKGFDLDAFKGATALTFAIAAALLVFYFSDRFGPWPALVIAAFFAGSRLVIDAAHDILPHGLAVSLAFLCLLIHRAIKRSRLDERNPFAAAGFLLVPVLLATFTRIAAVPMPAALIAYEVWRSRRVSRFTAAFALGFVILFLVASHAFPGGASYSRQLHLDPRLYAANALAYVRCLSYSWLNPWSALLWKGMFFATLPLAAWALWTRIRKGFELQDWFVVFHLTMLVLYTGGQNVYYLFPIFPIYLSYIIEAFGRLRMAIAPSPLRRAITAGASALFLAVPLSNIIAAARVQPEADGPTLPSYRDLLAHVQADTAPDAKFVAAKPRAFALLSGRRGGFYIHTTNSADFVRNLEVRRIDFVIVSKRSDDDREWLIPLMKQATANFPLHYENAEFALNRVVISSPDFSQTGYSAAVK